MQKQKDNSILKQKTFSGIMWKFFEKSSMQLISIIVQIVLARLLLPSDYGIIGYLMLFINLSEVFIQQGFTTALIQKKNADELDYSSVFFANLIMSVVIYVIFFFLAPFVAWFYDEPKLIVTMRILSINVIIGAFSAVHNAIMAKNLEFKKSFIRGLAYIISYGVSGILLAYFGFGVWSLIISRLFGLSVGAIVLWVTVKWKPSLHMSTQRLRVLFGYSSKVLGSNLLNTVYNNINPLIIGKFYESEDLGYYQRGQNIPISIMTAVDGSMNEVMYPTFSKLQDNTLALKSALRRSMRLSLYIILPFLIGLFVTAKPLTLLLLTEKWLTSVPYMQLTCIICMFWPLTARTHALNAMGKSGLTFKLSIISKIISLALILIMAKFGVTMIMIGNIIASTINFFITSMIMSSHLNYSLIEITKDILPQIMLSAFMGAIVYCVQFLGFSSLITLLIQIPVGVFVYIALSKLFHIDSFDYLLSTIKGIFGKKKKES